jgi:uncharacterized Zn finger protein
MRYGYWKPYVSVAKRRSQAQSKLKKLQKSGLDVQPIEIEGRKIAKSFWGAAWCDHLESFGDYANRIPRGRTYVRNGSVCHLAIKKGKIEAMVSGSEMYNIKVSITRLDIDRWNGVKKKCTGHVSSVLELLQGKLSASVMGVVTDKKTGLFPSPKEIKFSCDCPDYASMCKHIAAVLYGVGARLDSQPELLFTLRGVNHHELITADIAVAGSAPKKGVRRRIASDALADVFGIDMAEDTPVPKVLAKVKKAAKKAAKKSVKKKVSEIRRAPEVITSESIIALRKKFNMTQIEFSHLVGVSTLTVQNWEEKGDTLKLRKKSEEALKEVFKLTKRKAWQEMEF